MEKIRSCASGKLFQFDSARVVQWKINSLSLAKKMHLSTLKRCLSSRKSFVKQFTLLKMFATDMSYTVLFHFSMHHVRGTTFQATATMKKRFSLTNANDLFRADTSLSVDNSRHAHLSVIIKNPASEIVNKKTPTVFIQLNASALIEFFAIQAQRLVEGAVYFKITFS